jgi:predicted porin
MKKTGGNNFRAFTDTLAEPSLNVDRTARAEGIHYTTPSIAGFNGYLTLEPNGVETDTYWAVGADYKFGQFLVAAAYESSPDTGTEVRGTFAPRTSPTTRSVASGTSVRVTSACCIRP